MQQACEGKLHFILALPMHRKVSKPEGVYRGQVVGWCLLHHPEHNQENKVCMLVYPLMSVVEG
jgi:hypothetical protein